MKFPTFFTVPPRRREVDFVDSSNGEVTTFDFETAVFAPKEIAITKMHRALSQLKRR